MKSDGSPRICLDLRKINDVTKKDAKSVPNVQEMYDMLQGKTIFSSLDLYSGFHQIELEDHCKEITAFTCGPLGFWEMTRMPFGACNSSATFQRTMELVLSDLLYSTSLVYVDDIIVHSSDPAEHICSLEKIFQRLKQHGLRLKPTKCTFFSSELRFLGHMVTSRGLEKDPSKIQAIQEWQRPTTVNQVRQFMGLCGFLRKFIKNFATIAAPITDLVRGYSNKRMNRKQNKVQEQANFMWSTAQEDAFLMLKSIIAEDVTLSYADFSRPFRLHTDACRTGLGAVLEQQESDNTWRPIGFASRRTNETERNYATHKLEFLALRWAITEKFADYLRSNFFIVYSDNNPLTYVLTNEKLDATAQRWVSSLEPFSFTIKYRRGVDNTVADALSRKYEHEDSNNTLKYQSWVKSVCEGFDEGDTPDEARVAAITIHDTMGTTVPTTNFNWYEIQHADEDIMYVMDILLNMDEYTTTTDQDSPNNTVKQLMKVDKHLSINDQELLYYDTRLVIPSSYQEELVKFYHAFGHASIATP